MFDQQGELQKYSRQYDNMIRYKPSYHELMVHVTETLSRHFAAQQQSAPVIGDFGAGTGNLTLRIAEKLPEARIHAVEVNEGFYARMQGKVQSLSNVQTQLADVETVQFAAEHFDAVCMIHVLNLTKNSKEGLALERIGQQLKPSGLLVIADIGRVLDIKRHGMEMVKCAWQQEGLRGLGRLYMNNRESARQNREFVKFQQSGNYPSHDLEQFSHLIASKGFEILEARDDFYLGADDFVVARKQGVSQ